MFLAAMERGDSVADALAHVARLTGRPLADVQHEWAAPGGSRERWMASGFFVDR